jgi:hypothetical protein
MISFLNSVYMLACSAALDACIGLIVIGKFIIKIRNASPQDRKQPVIYWLFAMLGTATLLSLYWATFGWIRIAYFSHLRGIPLLTLSNRLTWLLFIVEYYSIARCLGALTPRSTFTKLWIPIIQIVGISSISYILYIMIGHYHILAPEARQTEFILLGWLFRILILVLVPLIVNATLLYRDKNLPIILRKQLLFMAYGLIVPYVVGDIFSTNFFWSYIPALGKVIRSYTACALWGLVQPFRLYYFSNAMLRLRFLNLAKQVQAPRQYNFIEEFNLVLKRLKDVASPTELQQEARSFFKQAFGINSRLVHIDIFPREAGVPPLLVADRITAIHERVRYFFDEDEIGKKVTTLARHDVEFDAFDKNARQEANQTLAFLETIDADICIAIRSKQQTIGYIIIDHQEDKPPIINNVELAQMRVFAEYAGIVMDQLRSKSFEAIERLVHEQYQEIVLRHRQKEYYKETALTLLRQMSDTEVAVVSYRKNRLHFASPASTQMLELISLADTSIQQVRQLMHVADEACRTQQEQSSVIQSALSQRPFLCTALPDKDLTTALIVIRPQPLRLDAQQMLHSASEPSRWDYGLHLETTQVGAHIKAAFPGTTEFFTKLQQDFLRIGLSQQVIFLNAPSDDLANCVSLLKEIGCAHQMLSMPLKEKEQEQEYARELFGVNQLIEPDAPPGIFPRLKDTGLLYIHNIQLLSAPTQNLLAELIKHKWYQPLHSKKKNMCATRIICCAPVEPEQLLDETLFTAELGALLKQACLTIPSPALLAPTDRLSLIQGMELQIWESLNDKHAQRLSSTQHTLLLENPALSFTQLRLAVEELFTSRLAQEEKGVLAAVQADDRRLLTPEIIGILRLGKHALKERKCLQKLVEVFKHQTKIAEMLGVNKSSVSRRCKEFGLETEPSTPMSSEEEKSL